MVSELRARARIALDAGPAPYAELDVAMATRLGGALWLIGAVYALIVIPIAPPDRGALGWIGAAACIGAAIVAGVRMLKRREPLAPDVLLAIVFGGIAVATLFRWFAGPGSPFGQLLFLAVMYSAAVHPARRTLAVLLAASAAAVSPMAYEAVDAAFAAKTAGELALTWSLGGLILVWTTRMRGLRREVRVARDQAERLARVDPLTGLGNPRALEEALPAAVAGARRDGKPFSVLVADLDAFKSVNDAFGHHAGDEMIRAVARALTTAVRLPDPCFRWGGDEFVALLPGASVAEAAEIAARVSSTVALSCRRPDGTPQQISTGVAELASHESGADIVARADTELLAAKEARRHGASVTRAS